MDNTLWLITYESLGIVSIPKECAANFRGACRKGRPLFWKPRCDA